MIDETEESNESNPFMLSIEEAKALVKELAHTHVGLEHQRIIYDMFHRLVKALQSREANEK